MAKKENIVYYGTGRRKNAIARVRLVEGTGKITINKKKISFKDHGQRTYLRNQLLARCVSHTFNLDK